jgi:hypothetical protein
LAFFWAPSYSVSLLSLQSTFFVFNTFWPLLQKQGGGVSLEPFELNRSSASHFPGFNVA